jgi:uncharacterized protein (TIGR01777 family)
MPDPHIIISGASGIVGQRFIEALREAGYQRISVLTRSGLGQWPSAVTPVLWNPRAAREGQESALDQLAWVLDGASALVNLAGASIAAGRLDAGHRALLIESRVDAANTLLAAARRASVPPRVWLQASAVGIYGDRGDELLSDDAAIGDPARDLLVPTGQAWEASAAAAANLTRLVTLRIGVVLDREAEAWQKLRLPISLFVGGPLGSGRQWMPWISGRDLARAMLFLLERDSASGTYNLCAPESARQIDITRATARAMRRPALVPAPAFLLRLALGQLADALLLSSQRVVPQRLLEAGFEFEHPNFEAALPTLL